METKLKSVEVTTEWWVDKIQGSVQFNSSNRNINVMINPLTSTILKKEQNRLTASKISAFKKYLNNFIESEIKEYGRCDLMTGYGPLGILSKVANETQITKTLFPRKTNMIITKDKVMVAEGYGNYKTIYSE